ncbi:5-oxoprolinase subunit PxpB [Aquimarina algiphila]|uniref:5-oxoprolinase subunit PxpB n=1 Tax=Aquimarina algiphila TaxID=2047982 RepID=UPI002492DAEA|nr:5-oxoprolinase subunit PxpB [Aquimarina algiphila]
MSYELRYWQYSEKAILIEWPSVIDKNVLHDLLFYKKSIESFYGKLIVEVISGYNSLLIYYVSTIEKFYDTVFELKTLYSSNVLPGQQENRLWKIPVCYSPALAPDLNTFAKNKSLSVDEIIALHTAPRYTIFFIGFLPGFLYLGGLDSKLHLPRKNTPSLEVKKGSVAIGGNQTGIYPVTSPGGWHVIGVCPLDFFNPNAKEFTVFEPGDTIQFMSIKEYEYNDVRSKCEKDNFLLKSIII